MWTGRHLSTRGKRALAIAPRRPPGDEEERLQALRRLAVLDTDPEERFDPITRLAAALFEVPIALVSLVCRS